MQNEKGAGDMTKTERTDCGDALPGAEEGADIELVSEITCPECGHKAREEMPVNACQFFYYCTSCKARLRPHAGDCCVYCSYGTVPCPPVQLAAGGNKPSCC